MAKRLFTRGKIPVNYNTQAFLKEPGVIFDVRSPAEFFKGHLSGAINLPLFSDRQRAEVGTAYHKEGKEKAVRLGLSYAGPRLRYFVDFAAENLSAGKAKLYCWRGGKRSRSIAWLLKQAHIDAIILEGGYKAYRAWSRDLFAQKRNFYVLGGLTGVGKTKLLHLLQERGEQVLNLEELAKHKGSRFGALDDARQPSTEQFHNLIAAALTSFDPSRPIWTENEGLKIGACHLPEKLYLNLRSSKLIIIERPLEERINHLTAIYGGVPKDKLERATRNIGQKLGGERTKKIIAHIEKNELRQAIKEVLHYYDRAYRQSMAERKYFRRIYKEELDFSSWADQLLISGI